MFRDTSADGGGCGGPEVGVPGSDHALNGPYPTEFLARTRKRYCVPAVNPEMSGCVPVMAFIAGDMSDHDWPWFEELCPLHSSDHPEGSDEAAVHAFSLADEFPQITEGCCGAVGSGSGATPPSDDISSS